MFDPTDYTYKSSAPRGLFDMIAGTDEGQGADFSGRLGVLAQILASVGTGRAMPDIAGSLAALDDRSSKRRDRAKAERMVARAAGKIAEHNPELAAAMMANPEFGMQMLGKQYESEWAATNRERELRQEYTLKGELETAQLREKERIRQEGSPFFQMWKQLQAGGGGAAPETAAPAPGISDLGSIPAPTGLTAGPGTEPAPANLPLPGSMDAVGQPISAQPDLQQPVETQPQATAPQQVPMSFADLPQPELSRDPTMAEAQKRFAPLVGVPLLSAGEVSNLMAAEQAGGTDTPTIITAILKTRQDQLNHYRDLAEGIAKEHRDATGKSMAEATTISRQEALPGQRQQTYLDSVPDITGFRGARGSSQVPVELQNNPQMQGVLQNEGIDNVKARLLGDPELVYNQILSAEGAGGTAPLTARSGLRTDLTKARTDEAAATQGRVAGRSIQATAKAMSDTLTADRQGQLTQPQLRMKAQLDTIATMQDPAKAAEAFAQVQKNYGDEVTALRNASLEERKVLVQEKGEEREGRKQTREEQEADAKYAGAEELTLVEASNAKAALDDAIEILADPNNSDPVTGLSGQIDSWRAGSTSDQIDSLLETATGLVALMQSQALRKYSPTGAGLGGSTSDNDIILLRGSVSNVERAIRSGKGGEKAIKRLYNNILNTLTPDSGERYDPNTPGWNLEQFDMKRHNPARYTIQQRSLKTEEDGVTIELQ